MVMSKRERYIGLVTIAVLAILVLDQFIIGPSMERMATLDADIAKKQQEMLSAQQLFASSNKALSPLKIMQKPSGPKQSFY